MSVFTQEFVGSAKAAAESPVIANAQFAHLSFRRREFTEFSEGEYRISYADGRSSLIKARSALEAMEQALVHGAVKKVERSTIKRIRLIKSENVRDLDPNLVADALIKPGAILVSFDTMTKVVHQQHADSGMTDALASIAASDAAHAAAPAMPVMDEPVYAPVEEAAAEFTEALPAMEEPQPEAGFAGDHDYRSNAAPASDERALTPEEIENLLHNQNPKPE